MSLLFKTSRNSSIVTTLSNLLSLTARPYSSTFANSKSLLFNNQTTNRSDLSLLFNRHIYTFRLTNKLTRNKRSTRPKRTNDSTLPLNYEQAQFAEKLGVNKSWNSWNTCKQMHCFIIWGSYETNCLLNIHYLWQQICLRENVRPSRHSRTIS